MAVKTPVKIVGGILQRDPEWSDDEYAERLRRHREQQRLGSAHLLALAAAHVVKTICTLPEDVDADEGHVRHVLTIADIVEKMAETNGYWSTDAAQALMDLKSARLRAVEFLNSKT
jgi:hypothetical protein